MTTPEIPTSSSPTTDGGAPPAPPAANAEPKPEIAHVGSVDASTSNEGSDPDDGDDGEGEGEAGAEGAATAEGAPGEPKKKRRRRRRKKGAKAPGAEGATAEGVAADGSAPAEGAAAAGAPGKGGKKREKKKFDENRERPAFAVGEVVFGKITEITDEVLFVDLSGKARALFDRRELDLPDEDPSAPDEDDSDADEAEAEGATAEGVETQAADAPVAETSGEDGASAPETPAVTEATEAKRVRIIAPTLTEDAPAEAPVAASATEGAGGTEGADAIAGDAAAEAVPAAPAGPAPVAPPVVLEVGANFVGVVHNDGGRGGLVVLTRHPKRVSRAKAIVAGAFKEQGPVLGLVTGVIKGGLEVDVEGLRAFAPGSQVDLRRGADLHYLIGTRLPFVVTQYAKRGRDVVLTRRAFLEEEAKAGREQALANLKVGDVVKGTVRSVREFGAFLDIGGIDGLVPLTEMSHNRGDGPHDVFKVGSVVDVKIVKIDPNGKVSLSRKATLADPWAEAVKKYAVGTRHTGKVARIQPFGVFVELESGIDGLVHTADLSIKRIEHPSEVVKVGDSIDVVVSQSDAKAHRIALHPAPSGDAAAETPQRIQLHKPLKVMVVSTEAAGVTVRVLGVTGRASRGFITSMATGTPRGTELKKVFPVGTVLDAKVIEFDPRKGDLRLSIKALNEETERSAYQQYRQAVSRDAKFTFADLIARKGLPQK
ncbi:MAG: S1 RNA-binding domain-containing protein [Polyangiaceae bacterium]